jgi:hypothetical protein
MMITRRSCILLKYMISNNFCDNTKTYDKNIFKTYEFILTMKAYFDDEF